MRVGYFLAYFKQAIQSAKQAFNFAKLGEFRYTFSEVGEVAKNIFHFVGFAWSAYEIYNLVQRTDLKRRQKILPILGYSLAGAAALATGIVVCAGATFLLPPFIFVGAVFNVVRNVGLYFKERAEKRNLEKEFKQASVIDHKINQLDFPEKLRHDVREFIKLPHFDKHKIQELYVRIGHHFINKTAKEQKELSDLIQKSKIQGISAKEKTALRSKIKKQEKALNSRFNNDYGELFTLLEKKQKLHTLKKSVKGRLVNIFISAGIAVLSLVTMALTFAFGPTPAAPGVVAAVGVLGGASAALSVAAAANSSKLSYQFTRGQNKVQKPKEEVAKAVYPSLKKVSLDSKNKQRSDVLYEKGLWTRFKDGVKNVWAKLWKKTPEERLEKPQSVIKKTIHALAQREFKATLITPEEMAIPKGVVTQRRAQFTSHFRAQDETKLEAPSATQSFEQLAPKNPKKL